MHTLNVHFHPVYSLLHTHSPTHPSHVFLHAGDIQVKNDELRSQLSKLRVAEAELAQRSTALSSAQEQLGQLSEQQSEQLLRADELHVGHYACAVQRIVARKCILYVYKL